MPGSSLLCFQRNSRADRLCIIRLAMISIFSWFAIGCSSIPPNGVASNTTSSDGANTGVRVRIAPLNPSLALGGRLQFTATVSNTSNSAVIWSASAGTITSEGFYSAPTNPKIGTATVTVSSRAQPSAHVSATVSLTNSTLTVISSTLPSALVGTAYSEGLIADGGTPPYTWNLVSGSLPTGLQLASSSGTIRGTATEIGLFNLTARVTDATANTAERSLTLSVAKQAANCGPPTYNCSRTDVSFVPVPATMPRWGGLEGTNTVVNDPDFHNPIVRVTDASLGVGKNFCTGLGGSGDVPQVWNADSTILLICSVDGGAYFPIGFDPVNFKSLGPLYGTNPIFNSGGGVFSHTNPNLFYAFSGGKLQTIDYTNRTTPPTPQLLYDYGANCGVGTTTWQSNGGSDLSDTVFSAGFSTAGAQGTGVIVAAYNSSTGICYNFNTSTGVVTKYPGPTVVGTVTIPDRFTVHNVKMKGGTTLVVSPQGCIAACGAHPYAWVIGTTEMYGLGSPKGSGHWAVGCGKWLNQPGDLYDYSVIRDFLHPALWSSVWPVSSSECGGPPKMACAQPFDSHPAWLGDCSDTGPVCMATVAASDVVQYPYQNEIVCFTTDGSNRRIRFAHTYSSIALGSFYARESIGAPSQDGRFYAWTTQAGGQFGCPDGTSTCALLKRRSDVLVVKLQ